MPDPPDPHRPQKPYTWTPKGQVGGRACRLLRLGLDDGTENPVRNEGRKALAASILAA